MPSPRPADVDTVDWRGLVDRLSPTAQRREQWRRGRWRRVAGGLTAISLIGLVLGLARHVSGSWRGVGELLLAPGFLVPIGLLGGVGLVVWLVRRRLGHRRYRVVDGAFSCTPGWLAAVLQGVESRRVAFSEIAWVGVVCTQLSAELALASAAAEGAELPAPVRIPLVHPDLPRLVEALEGAKVGLPGGMAVSRGETLAEALGLWHTAAREAWRRMLSGPGDLAAARALYRVERYRLPIWRRLRLLDALIATHPSETPWRLARARLRLALGMRAPGRRDLQALVEVGELDAASRHWLNALDAGKRTPAPKPSGALGLDIRPSRYRLEARQLIIDDVHRVDLTWFVAYRVVPGFFGPRQLVLFDLWGVRRALPGDPLDWAARLARAAPHLTPMHDELLETWGVGRYLRRLEQRKAAAG